MRFTLGGVRRAAAILTALVAPAVLASPAAALNIGSPSLAYPSAGDTGSALAVMQTEFTSATNQVTGDGFVSDFGAAFTCDDGACGPVKLVVVRESFVVGFYDVVGKSESVTPDGGQSSERFPITALKVKAGDRLALELTSGTRVKYASWPGGSTMATSQTAVSGQTKTFEQSTPDRLAIFNATVELMPKVTTTVTGSPNPVLAGSTVTYDVTVAAPTVDPASSPSITGTVSLTVDGDPVPGCQDLPVANAKASCQSAAPAQRTWRQVKATYSGDDYYAPGTAGTFYQSVIEPASVLAVAHPNPVPRSAKISYSAEIANVQLDSVGSAEAASYGSAAFFVDGQPIAACAEQPVDHDGVAKCLVFAPDVVGPHTLKVVYSGDHERGANSAQTTFDVIGPDATVSGTGAFDPTGVGTTALRTVTLTSAGKVALKLKGVALTGDAAFSVVSDGCAEGELAHSKTCDVVVAYRPTAAGTHTATLAFGHDAGGSTVALSGTAVAPAAPVAPTPTATPTPTPTPKAATIDPEKKPTFTVSVPTGGSANASSVPTLKLPLSCPANTECQLDGKLTIEESALTNRKAKASAASTRTVAKFSKVQVEAGGLKTVKLKLSKAFVKSAQERGVRRIRATLTINTVLGSGEKLTTAQRITIVIPKAAKKQAAAKPKVAPRFTG